MANILEITPEIIQTMTDAIDDLVSQLSRDSRLYYPPKIENCSCTDTIGQKPSGRASHGGPIPIPNLTGCPFCGGSGKREVEQSEIIQLLITADPARYDDPNRIPGGILITRTYLYNLPKIKMCRYMKVTGDVGRYGDTRYFLLGEPVDDFKIAQNKYLICYWERK